MLALVNSGRSERVNSCPIKVDRPLSSAAAIVSTFALPPSAGAVSNAVERPEANGEIINVGTDEEVSIADLAAMMHRLSGEPGALEVKMVPYQSLSANYQDVMRRVPDLTKMRRILGLETYVPLEEGLSRLWSWYRRVSDDGGGVRTGSLAEVSPAVS